MSLWAQSRQQSDATNPPPPDSTSVWASIDPQAREMQKALAEEKPTPPMASAAPQVTLAKPIQSPEDQQVGADSAKLQKFEWQDQNPWGTENNHPGKLGKIAHTFSTLGNIAGDIFAPGTMARIPGTQLNREAQEGTLAKQLETETTADSADQYRGAETAKDTEETAEMPGKAADTHALAESEITEHNAQAAALLHPQAKTDFEAWQQQNPGRPIEDWLKEVKTNAPGNDFEQYYKDYLTNGNLSDTAQNRVAAREKWAAASQAPQRAPVVNMFVPAANGGETLQTVRPGQTVAPGAQTSAGVNAVDTPTSQQRTAAGRAQVVVEMAPEVMADIDKNAAALGPMMGRWNDFMQGKVGSDNPDFAALRSNLLMMSSAVALAHAQGRLPENLREEFDRAINAPQQTPENLKATINAMLPWLTAMQHQGQPNTQGPQAGAPAVGAIENGFRFKGGDPGQQSSWEQVKK